MPVGAVLSLGVYAPSGYTVDPNSINWNGGTYKGYFSNFSSNSVSNNPGMAAVQVQKITAADKKASSYTVIADPGMTNLNIQLSVAYYINPSNPAAGDYPAVTTTMTGSVVKPTIATTSGQAGQQGLVVQGGQVIAQYSPAVQITATTQTAAFSGNFMMIQLINANRSYVDATGTPHNWTNPKGGWALDDGADGADLPIGMNVPSGGSNTGWFMPSNAPAPVTYTTTDPPQEPAPVNSKSISVSDTFQTYLMYTPVSGVWVALSETDWSFTASGTNTGANGNNVWPVGMSPAPAPTNKTPSGDNAFPSWNNDSSSF